MTNRYKDVKELAIPMVPNLIIIALILLALKLLKPSHWFTMLIIVLPFLAISILRSEGKKAIPSLGGNLFLTSCYLIGFWYLIMLLGKWGWLGLVIIVVGFSAWRLIKGKKQYFQAMRSIEKKVFGKPLDKELWKGEKNDK